MRTFSPGACGPTISGPIETISTPGSRWPRTAHSRPPWTTVSSGCDPNSRAWTSFAVDRSDESRSGSHGRVRAPDLDLCSAETGQRVHRGEDAVERSGVRASRHRPEHERSVLRRGGRQARARLDDSGQAGSHRDDAGRDRLHEVECPARCVDAGRLAPVLLRERERELVVRARVLADDPREPGLRGRAEARLLAHSGRQSSRTLHEVSRSG